jgi:phosphatidylglycerophosphate synthase
MTPTIRIQQNILALSERRLLTWLCARLPMWVKPDYLTALGFLGAIFVAMGYALSSLRFEWLWLSIGGYFINWFGDSLDGSIARFRKIERPDFGYFIDHSVDSLANTITAIGLGLSPFVRLDVALFCLAGYLLLSIHTFLAARVVAEFRLSYLAAGPTELRLILIAMTVAMLIIGPKPVWSFGFSGFDLFIGGVAIVLVSLFVVQTIKTAWRLSRKD